MKLRQRVYAFWLTHDKKIEKWLLIANLVAIPVFVTLYWLGLLPYLPFGSPNECGTGPYKWAC